MHRLLLLLSLVLLSAPAFAQPALSRNVRLLCNWFDTTNAPLISGQRFNDVWGLTHNGREYAVIGSSNGTHLIDVNDCREVTWRAGRSALVLHRDFQTFGKYLYAVADEGPATLQIFDYSYLPDSLHLVYESDPDEFSRSHNIFIDTAMAKLYCASFTNNTTGHDYMRVYSLQRPDLPVLITRYNEYGDVHDVYVRNDTAYCSSSFFGYLINRFNVPGAPYETIGGLLSYPYQGFNHSSWISNNGIGVMADETYGSPVKVIDTRIIVDPKVLATFSPRGTDSTSVAHNPFMLGNFAFVSYYQDGVHIYDLTDPRNPRQTGFYDTYPAPSTKKFAGAWGCYPFLPSRKLLVSDMQSGLHVLDAEAALGIRSIPAQKASLEIHPNPADKAISISFPAGVAGLVNIALYDVVGSRVLASSMPAANGVISLPLPAQLKAGTYMLRAEAGRQVFTGRFTKL
jgi:choice-of-anchor B domain-containing protein